MKSLDYFVEVKILYNSGTAYVTKIFFEGAPTEEQVIETVRSNYMLQGGGGKEGGIENISAVVMECEDGCYFEENEE